MKRQLRFTLKDIHAEGSEPMSFSTFCPVGMRPASAIALRVSNVFGFPCTVHENAGPTGDAYRVSFFDETADMFRDFYAHTC